MSTSDPVADARSVRRLEIKTILAGYPEIPDHQLETLRNWFNREASALDIGLLASDEELRDAYRAFRKDHVDRFAVSDILKGLAFAVLIVIIALGLVLPGL